MNVIGSNLNKMMLGMELVLIPDPNNPGQNISVPAVVASFFNYLIANNIDITPLMQKSFDSSHSIIVKQLVTGKQRLSYFQDVKPPENEHMLIFAIRAYTGVNATVEETAWVPGIADPLTQNGTFDILSNGTRIMRDHPLEDFTQAEEEPYSGWMELPKPLIWQAQSDLEMQVTFPTAPTTATQNLAFEVWGIKLIG